MRRGHRRERLGRNERRGRPTHLHWTPINTDSWRKAPSAVAHITLSHTINVQKNGRRAIFSFSAQAFCPNDTLCEEDDTLTPDMEQ
ncbi:RNA-directed RNA polymerase L [Clarias magur]|uniref:RNA-directed RNA polymerase L n=1 Tax=Clarias magur TaxID=1594786 RepID=A0A8J4UVJ6_CLAMG|nr:RNA-directed RNA polymerase L [Clarias magur]